MIILTNTSLNIDTNANPNTNMYAITNSNTDNYVSSSTNTDIQSSTNTNASTNSNADKMNTCTNHYIGADTNSNTTNNTNTDTDTDTITNSNQVLPPSFRIQGPLDRLSFHFKAFRRASCFIRRPSLTRRETQAENTFSCD